MTLATKSTAETRPAGIVIGAGRELIQLRDLVYRSAGIFHADDKLRLLEDRCRKRMQAVGASTLREYYESLTAGPDRRNEIASLLNEITIGETCFFRNQPQLDALRTIVLPKVVEAREKLPLRHLRLWSAGCSTGEEAYTLGMMLMEEQLGRLKGWTFEVLATDLNERSLMRATAGVYGEYSTRNLAAYYRHKYFSRRGTTDFEVRPEVKANVKFSRLNLLDDARMTFMKGLDVIMCCNVLIYFDAKSKLHVMQHFYNNLLPHGYLLLGHSESLYGLTDDFRLVQFPMANAYIKSESRKPLSRQP